MTAFARIYLGQHYFSDCFVAILYGLPFGIALENLYFNTPLGFHFQGCFGVSPYSEYSVLIIFAILLLGLCLALLMDKEPQRFWDKGIVVTSLYTAIYAALTAI